MKGRLTLQQRLVIPIILLGLVAFLSNVLAVFSINNVHANAGTIVDEYMVSEGKLEEIRRSLMDIHRLALSHIVAADHATMIRLVQEIKAEESALDEKLAAYKGFVSSEDQETYQSLLTNYDSLKHALVRLVSASADSKTQDAYSMANGDVANKVGTLGLGILAAHFGIPLYVAAPLSTIDLTVADGSCIPIEERAASEVMPHPIAGVEVRNPAFDATPASFVSRIITEAGGQNAAAEIEDNYWATISYEQLITWDPDYIVIVPEATYTVDDVLNTPQLANLSAVMNGHVYAMPSAFEAWDSPVPSGILGTLWMTSLLHSDVYSFETMQDAAADFYQTFYGFQLNKADLTQ